MNSSNEILAFFEKAKCKPGNEGCPDGNVFSCPRGQSSEHYCYGNIFEDDIETIISNGWSNIERNENCMEIDDECAQCEYMPYCNLGCTFVRQETGLTKKLYLPSAKKTVQR